MKSDSPKKLAPTGPRLEQARVSAGFRTAKEFSDKHGFPQATYHMHEAGTRGLKPDVAENYAMALGNCDAGWLLTGRGVSPSGQNPTLKNPQSTEDTDTPESSVDLRNIRHYAETEGELPVYGSVQGGFDGAAIDREFPVEWIKMPSILVGVKNAFGCYVVNDSVEPRYYQGEIVLVHPGRPVKRGDWVVVELEGHQGIVKRFVRQNDGHIELEQLNPHKTVKLDRKKVVGVHLIVGSFTK